MTRKIIIFQIKQKQKSIFNLLKNNKNESKNLVKKCAFKRFKFACEYSKENILAKKNNYKNLFCKILYTKCGIISLKNFLLNKKINKEQQRINKKKAKFLNIKINTKFFINELKRKIKIKKIENKYNNHLLNQNYILFFKSVAISMQKTSLYKQKNIQAKNFYLINLIKKNFFLWKKNAKIKQDINNKKLRRKIIGKIFINNLRINLYEQKLLGMKYNQILLKKYYFNRLRRTVHFVINNKIAKLKFISKYIFLWKEISHTIRINKFNGLILFSSKIYPKLFLSYIYKLKKIFIFKFKQKNICLLQNEIINTKVANFKFNIQSRLKKNIFLELKYNFIINHSLKKRNLIKKKKIFELIKLNKNKGMSKELKQYEADKLYIKHMKLKIKQCLNNWRFLSNETIVKINEMRNKFLKKKIFIFLKIFLYKNKKRENKIATKFRTYFLYYNFFLMIKKHNYIIKREKKIINGVQRLINENELDYKYWAFKSIYNNFLVENFIKQRNLRLKTKIFYLLKMLCS